MAKVIRSAQANAENNFNLVRDDLVVKDIRVEPGPMLKRGQPRAMGRLFSVFKRTSHITAIVEDRPGAVRRRTATLPRAPQPSAARPTPAAAAAARAAGARDAGRPAEQDAAGTTESDERETPPRPAARQKATAEASTRAEKGKKGEAKSEGKAQAKAPQARSEGATKTRGKASAEGNKTQASKTDDKKKDSKEKKSK